MHTAGLLTVVGGGRCTHPSFSHTPCPIACWDTHTPAQLHTGIHTPTHCMLDYTPPAPLHASAPPTVKRMIDRCKNITLAQSSFAGGKDNILFRVYVELNCSTGIKFGIAACACACACECQGVKNHLGGSLSFSNQISNFKSNWPQLQNCPRKESGSILLLFWPAQ